MPRVVHFELPADDPQRAVRFYEQALGWKIATWEGPMDYWLVTTGEPTEAGIDGAIGLRANLPATCNTVEVPSLEEYSKRVEDAGGKMLTDRMTIAGVGYFRYCLDTEGNMFGLLESDASAK